MDALETFDRKTYLVMFVLAWIPDGLIAWAAMRLTDDETSTFWLVFLGIQIAVILFWAKRTLWAWIVWRLWGRDRTVQRTLMVLRNSELPRPQWPPTDADAFLEDIKNDESQPLRARIEAAQLQAVISAAGALGLLTAMRIRQAWDMALTKWAAS